MHKHRTVTRLLPRYATSRRGSSRCHVPFVASYTYQRLNNQQLCGRIAKPPTLNARPDQIMQQHPLKTGNCDDHPNPLYVSEDAATSDA